MKDNTTKEERFMEKKVEQNIFVRYDEGAKKYSMCKHTFMKLAQDAHDSIIK